MSSNLCWVDVRIRVLLKFNTDDGPSWFCRFLGVVSFPAAPSVVADVQPSPGFSGFRPSLFEIVVVEMLLDGHNSSPDV